MASRTPGSKLDVGMELKRRRMRREEEEEGGGGGGEEQEEERNEINSWSWLHD